MEEDNPDTFPTNTFLFLLPSSLSALTLFLAILLFLFPLLFYSRCLIRIVFDQVYTLSLFCKLRQMGFVVVQWNT